MNGTVKWSKGAGEHPFSILLLLMAWCFLRICSHLVVHSSDNGPLTHIAATIFRALFLIISPSLRGSQHNKYTQIHAPNSQDGHELDGHELDGYAHGQLNRQFLHVHVDIVLRHDDG